MMLNKVHVFLGEKTGCCQRAGSVVKGGRKSSDLRLGHGAGIQQAEIKISERKNNWS